jgi:hypothetical protein
VRISCSVVVGAMPLASLYLVPSNLDYDNDRVRSRMD